MRPRPTTEQFLPPAYGKTADGCKAGLSSCHAALTSYAETSAQVSGELYGYDYDNIGNRRLMFGGADYAVYTANELNQYTKVDTNGNDFTPEYDADGNQTFVQTGTGIWKVSYNAQNRAVKFENTADGTIITCAYDYMGRRFEKKVTTNGTITLHVRYLYRSYLQIAALDLLTDTTKHTILWDPTQPTTTRPLSIQQAGTYYTYAWDLTKNIIALFTPTATLSTTYTPFGTVTAEGDITQPIQWSSECYDTELALVYYNYRYYNPVDGRWTRREPGGVRYSFNLYSFAFNGGPSVYDILGYWGDGTWGNIDAPLSQRGHSDFPGHEIFNYTAEDYGLTWPINPFSTWRHFRNLDEVEKELLEAVKKCDEELYESRAHQMQDFFSHRGQGYTWGHFTKLPDDPSYVQLAYLQAFERTMLWLQKWFACCKKCGDSWAPVRNTTGDELCANLQQPDNPYGSDAAPPDSSFNEWVDAKIRDMIKKDWVRANQYLEEQRRILEEQRGRELDMKIHAQQTYEAFYYGELYY